MLPLGSILAMLAALCFLLAYLERKTPIPPPKKTPSLTQVTVDDRSNPDIGQNMRTELISHDGNLVTLSVTVAFMETATPERVEAMRRYYNFRPTKDANYYLLYSERTENMYVTGSAQVPGAFDAPTYRMGFGEAPPGAVMVEPGKTYRRTATGWESNDGSGWKPVEGKKP